MVVLLSQTKDILDPCVLIPRCSKHDPLMVNLVQEHAREARSFLIGRAVRRKKSFPGRPNTASIILLRSSLKGPSISLMYKEENTMVRLRIKEIAESKGILQSRLQIMLGPLSEDLSRII